MAGFAQPDSTWVRARVASSRDVKQRILEVPGLVEQILTIGVRITRAILAGRKVLFFGNGGSAADAQHLAAELVGRFYANRRPLPALALTADTSVVTAVSNDLDFAEVFARQVEAHGHPGDVAVAISTSGNSPNVLRALEVARARGLFTVGLTGRDGGKLRDLVDECICVPSTETPRIQEAHIMLGHILCEMVEQTLTTDQSR